MAVYEYIERPPTFLAVCFDGHEQSAGDIVELIGDAKSWSMGSTTGEVRRLAVQCADGGEVIAYAHDWVVRDPDNGIHVYSNSEFRKKFKRES